MSDHQNNSGWTLSGWIAHCQELRTLDIQLQTERERRYTAMDESNKAALKVALETAQKADEKTEKALNEYKIGANEWRKTVDDLISMQRGRGSVVDPQMEKLTAVVERLATTQATGAGAAQGAQHTKDEGRATTNLIIGGVGVLLTVGMFFLAFRDNAAPQAQVLPNVTYKPEPAPAAQPK